MRLRVCFENIHAPTCNLPADFKKMIGDHLAPFEPEWGGYITIDRKQLVGKLSEPCWQVFIDHTPAMESILLDFLQLNPIPGYAYHVWRERKPGEKEAHRSVKLL